MFSLRESLGTIADPTYAEFEAKLCPTLPKNCFLGVRVPALRTFAKEFKKTADCELFLHSLPHETYDENLLHSILLTGQKDFLTCIQLVEDFLPYIDNWAACDTLRPNVFKKHTQELLPYVKKWLSDDKEYTIRYGVDSLMTYYLDGEFKEEYLTYPLAIKSDAYYVRMMIAWYYATALAKQWDATIPYIEKKCLPAWTHNKTIQKAIESFRITEEQKDYLRSLRVK